MFDNFGMIELIIIVLLSFLVLGPEKLPKLMENIRKFRLWRVEMQAEIRDAIEKLETQSKSEPATSKDDTDNKTKSDESI